jgi:4-amino-4-deoxy-L-arabinose transferase-like glycosyltransferase
MPQDAESKGEFAHRFFFKNTVDADAILFLARLPITGLTLLLISGVYRWASELWGSPGGIFAACFAALDPNIIAHGQLATNDLGVTCFSFFAIYTFWRLLRGPFQLRRLFLAGLTTGLALATKFSAVIVLPVLALLGVVYLAQKGLSPDMKTGRQLILILLVIGLIALVVLVVDYGGEFRSLLDMTIEMQTLDEQNFVISKSDQPAPAVAKVPIPIPSYWYGLWLIKGDIQTGRSAFLWGERSTEGWWYYFPLALLIKTPLPTLIFVTLGLITILKLKSKIVIIDGLFLIIPALIWVGMTMLSKLNLGYRYLLPAWPFLFIVGGSSVLLRSERKNYIAVFMLIVWLAVTAIRIYPYHLAFFNQLVGGPEKGYLYLVDSNIDWGQDLKRLAAYQRDHEIGTINLSYFGTADPDYYGIDYECLPSYGLLACPDATLPRSGTFAISVTCLQGGCTADWTKYRWLLDETPSARIGYSILIYRLP